MNIEISKASNINHMSNNSIIIKVCKQGQQCEAHVNAQQSNSRQIMQYN